MRWLLIILSGWGSFLGAASSGDKLAIKAKDFFSLFPERQVPFRVSGCAQAPGRPLDIAMTEAFVEKDHRLQSGMMAFEVWRYYPRMKFRLGELWGVVVLRSGGAGGCQDEYFLSIHDRKGKKRGKLLLAKEIGDAGFADRRAGEVHGDFSVTVLDAALKFGDDERVLLRKSFSKKYRIEENGSIRLDAPKE